MRRFSFLFLMLFLSACALPKKAEKPKNLLLKPGSFAALPAWQKDPVQEMFPAFQKSCARILKRDPEKDLGAGGYAGTAADWREACEHLSLHVMATEKETRNFFERYFKPYAVYADRTDKGLITGYYEPTLKGSLKQEGAFQIPLFLRPDDLIDVNLGDFKPALKGEKISGRVEGTKLIPYYTRAEIDKGALAGKEKEVVFVDDAVDAFFLHIQGSGQVILPDQRILRVGYAAQNGHAYTAIGKSLIERGALSKENVSMQSIRAWLDANPKEAQDVMNINASYIFFQKLEGEEGPLGAEGVPLTPKRSLAVDRKHIPYGVPVFIDAEEPEGGVPLQRLMIAQDTGGAIRGPVRGDFFWGAGDEAAHKAGLMKSRGRMWLLLPKDVKVPEDKLLKHRETYNR